MLSCNCPKCGKFTKTVVKKEIHNNSCMILHCKKCNITYGRSVGYYLEVTGEMEPSVSGIMENSPTWKKLIGDIDE